MNSNIDVSLSLSLSIFLFKLCALSRLFDYFLLCVSISFCVLDTQYYKFDYLHIRFRFGQTIFTVFNILCNGETIKRSHILYSFKVKPQKTIDKYGSSFALIQYTVYTNFLYLIPYFCCNHYNVNLQNYSFSHSFSSMFQIKFLLF